jgi:hypothetical protein
MTIADYPQTHITTLAWLPAGARFQRVRAGADVILDELTSADP